MGSSIFFVTGKYKTSPPSTLLILFKMSVTRFHSLSGYPTLNPAPLFLAEVTSPVDEAYLTESQMPPVVGFPFLQKPQILTNSPESLL